MDTIPFFIYFSFFPYFSFIMYHDGGFFPGAAKVGDEDTASFPAVSGSSRLFPDHSTSSSF